MWHRAYIAIYGLMLVAIVSVAVPSCPDFSRYRFEVTLGLGCQTPEGVFSNYRNMREILGDWLIIAGVVAAIGLLITLARKRRPTWASVLVWFSAGIVVWWVVYGPTGIGTEYRSWFVDYDTMYAIQGILSLMIFVLAVPTGVALSVRRGERRKSDTVAASGG